MAHGTCRIYSIVSRTLTFCVPYIFFSSLSKGRDDAQSFLGCVLSNKFSFRILFLHFTITCMLRHRKDYDEQKAVVVVRASLPGLPIKRESF